MSSITSPLAGNAGQAATMARSSVTNPMAAGVQAGFPAAPAAEAIPALQVGVATQYWDECLAYPPGSTASLWLFVDNAWRSHDNASQATRDMVQRAFLASGSSVRVWYDGGAVVGLVVTGS